MYMYYPDNRAWSFYVARLIDESAQGGADFHECHRTLHRVRDGDAQGWYDEWTKTAGQVEALASNAMQQGHRLTARDSFLRAFTYYRTSQFWLPHGDPRKTPAFLRSLACFQQACKAAPCPFERVEIPFEGTALPGYFCPAQGRRERKAPALIFLGGADTFAEQLIFIGTGKITERGIACLTLSGPGQGEVLRLKNIFARPDYEKPVAAAIDLLQKRDEVDPKRIAIMGISLGGYYAARAAALDARIAACVLFGACYSVIEDIYDFYPHLRSVLEWIVGAKNADEARRMLKEFTLEGVINRMQCPLLICHGAEDFVVSPAAAEKTLAGARCPKELKMWQAAEGGAAHCMADNRAQVYAFMFDWVSEKLAG
ncbi:MAG: prolyl oligopeptidase family serine peptidase [Acidobacteria bacterium]|nr:prolyl oligopeptidase family serine peptidase [Acidobacteriota bacterium]